MKVCSSSSVCTPRPPSRSISPCSTSTVARASDSARWLGVVAERKTTARELSLQLGASSRVITRLARRAVSTTSKPGQGRSCTPAKCLRKPTSNGRVVGDQDGALRELEERRQRGGDRRCGGHHRVGDPGEHGDEGRDLGVRVDQRLELAENLTTAHLDGPDLGDHRAALHRGAGRLEVDHTERDVAQGPPQLVEAHLRGPPAHVHDARQRHRQNPGRQGRAGHAGRNLSVGGAGVVPPPSPVVLRSPR